MSRILLIDDDANLREVVSFALRDDGYEVEPHGDAPSALEALAIFRPDIVITDLKMPGMSGMELLERVSSLDPTVPVIMLTAFGSIEQAVEAMKHGAYHYLTKPYNRDELLLTVRQAIEKRQLQIENRTLRDRLREQTRRIDVVHASAEMERILEMVRRIAPTDVTVMLTGESGTGKEVLVNAIHAYSDRWEGPFVAVNCAAIPRDLIESELFGHVKGAFTGATRDKPGKFQRANGGTLFLDEIGDLQPDLQTKLLRVLESHEIDVVGGQKPVAVDVRVIAATNADLAAKVSEGSFREDLFYRLNVIPIRVPPLRERRDDIPALWDHFVRSFRGEASITTSPALRRALVDLPWPGNVRQLANVCQRMVLLRRSDVLDVEDLPPEMTGATELGSEGAAEAGVEEAAPFLGELPSEKLPLMDVEKEIILRALARHDGNRSRTARYLGIPRHVLIYRLQKFGIG